MSPKTVTALEPDPDKVTSIEKLIGGLCLGQFVCVWLLSAASPFLFVPAILYKYYISAALIALVTFLAYAPWEKGAISKAIQQNYEYYAPRYFQRISMVFEGDHLPTADDPQTFYAIHPHGAFCIGWALLFSHSVMQHVRFCFAPFLYASPFFRLFSRCTGNPGSASKLAMVHYMRQGEHLALPPGGFEEATLSCTTQDRVFIKKRTGFIRLCLQHGIAVRPVYVFGEKSLFWNIQGGWKTRLAVNRYGLPTILTWGHPLFCLVPKNTVPIHIAVGAPLALPKIDKPSKEDVVHWHNKYVAALTKLFEDHKEVAYGPADAKTMKLEVW
jgi:hypothetical protein